MPDDARIRELFDRASDLPEGEREAFVRGAAANEAEAERVLQLLRQAATQSDILERPVAELFEQLSRQAGGRIAEFELLERIGAGGMGVVFRARDTKLRRDVAIKILAPHLATSQQARGKLLDEAQAAAKLQHPNIVPVYKCDSDGGVDFIVSEYIRGSTVAAELLAERARRSAAEDTAGARNWQRRCTEWAAGVADALETAHRAGIVHRDVKPSNILLDEQGRPRLTDFGIALDMTEDTLTQESTAVGTCFYMSPEQATAARARVDHRSDIYSLGVVLYEMLSLQRPFDGSSVAAVLQAVLLSDPPSLRKRARGIPRDLETICAKAMRRNPVERYQTVGHLSADLRSYLAGDPILARPEGLVRRVARTILRRRVWFASGALVLLAGAAIGAALWALSERDSKGVRVRVNCVEADARIAIVDLESGTVAARPRRAASVWLPVGRYRVVAASARVQGFSEQTVNALRPGRAYEVLAEIRPTAEVVADMVHISGGEHKVGGDRLPEREVTLADFWIDRSEVSNGQYRAFMEATGYRAPLHWQVGAPPPDELPVVCVSYTDAARYAAWAGKRLVLGDEWEAAARAPDGRLLPWGDGAPPPSPPAEWAIEYQEARGDKGYRLYLTRTVPVNSVAVSRTPLGLNHMWGNVIELTDSLDLKKHNVQTVSSSWHMSADSFDLASRGSVPQFIDPTTDLESQMGVSPDHGFRCAKSATPPGLQ